MSKEAYKTCSRLGHDWMVGFVDDSSFEDVTVELTCQRCNAEASSGVIDVRTYDGRHIEWVLID